MLFKNMRGAWEGKAQQVTCRGDVNAPREEATNFTVETDVDTALKNAIIIKSSLHSSEKKQSYKETLAYYLTPNRLGITEFTRAGDVELINVAPNFLVYLRKENKRTPAGGLVAQEFVRSIALYDHQDVFGLFKCFLVTEIAPVRRRSRRHGPWFTMTIICNDHAPLRRFSTISKAR